MAQILNKPSLATVATSGDYDDLTNKPTIPDSADEISYDNTTSGMTATDVQEAIDENATEIVALTNSLTQLSGDVTSLAGKNIIVESIVTNQTATTTETTFNTYNGRKFSDYKLFILRVKTSNTNFRDTRINGTSSYTSGFESVINTLHGSDSATITSYSVNSMVFKYGSDTSIKVKLQGSCSLSYFDVLGVRFG